MARFDRDRHYISWPLMVISAVLLLTLFVSAMVWLRKDTAALQAQDNTLQLQVSVLEMSYADLQAQLKRVGSEGYVENAAREQGFIRRGEIVFAFEDPDMLRGYTEEEYRIIMDEMRD